MFKRSLLSIVALSALGLGLPLSASATVTASTSNAYGEFVNLTVTPNLGAPAVVTSGPFPFVSGSAPSPYSLSDSAASVVVDPYVTTGLLSVNASSDVDSLTGTRNASADATVNDISVLLNAFGIDLSATTVQSTAAVTGDFGALNALGTTTIEELELNGVASLFINPAPNTVFLDIPGLTVTLNEQVVSGDFANSSTMAVNGVHISFDNYLSSNLSVISGDVILSHSEAMMMAVVPEPETYAMLVAGLALMGAMVKRRESRSKA